MNEDQRVQKAKGFHKVLEPNNELGNKIYHGGLRRKKSQYHAHAPSKKKAYIYANTHTQAKPKGR